MDVVIHAHSDSKWQVRMNLGMKLIRINLSIKLIICMWLEAHINLFDSVHWYGCGQAHLGLILHSQYIRNELSDDTNIFHIACFTRNNKLIQWFQVAYSNSLVLDTIFHCGLLSREGGTPPNCTRDFQNFSWGGD